MAPTTTGFEKERLELEAILASGIFNRAPNLAHVLIYVCSKHFEGAADQIKEYNIAVEALGRPADFDQKRDSIVRVEAHRLRKRLKEFYETEGATHAVRIEIPSGQYAPRFLFRETADAPEPAPEAVAPEAVELEALPEAQAPPPIRRWKRYAVIAALAAAAAGVALAAWTKWPQRPAAKTTAAFAGARAIGAAPIAAVKPDPEVRLMAGFPNGVYIDRFGRTWQGDRYFDGGSVFDSINHLILGAGDARIYQTRREGTFSYNIPLAPGVYELRLHFAETLYGEANAAGGGETSRLFNVFINGAEALHEFDVISDAGADSADIRAFKDISPAADGKLHLRFESHTNPAFVNAIEITPGTSGRLRPIRMVTREHAYKAEDGRTWEPDFYARGGQLVARPDPVDGEFDPELFHGERFGNIRYVVPVPPGKYEVAFYFAERWFGPGKAAGGGEGSRLFDILCNGVALRRNFDIYREAHGANRAVRLVIHGLEPNAQGQLAISLVPVRNYACVNAIEVTEETAGSGHGRPWS
jgi:hypothetical protein